MFVGCFVFEDIPHVTSVSEGRVDMRSLRGVKSLILSSTPLPITMLRTMAFAERSLPDCAN